MHRVDTEREPGEARFARLLWNAPLSESHADRLLHELEVGTGEHVLDLGCGWGELLLRAVASGGPGASGTGLDTDAQALARGSAAALERGLADRVAFENAEVVAWTKATDRVLCVGASHAWGGTAQALEALAGLLAPGARLLFGDGFWEREPSDAAVEMFGGEVLTLAALSELAVGHGLRLLHMSTADQREWDEFESAWRAGRERWLLAHPDAPGAQRSREQIDERIREYVSVYRGVLGFAYLLLAR